MFTLGVQTERLWNFSSSPPSWYIRLLYCARNSVLATSNTLYNKSGLNEAAMAMGSGNTVTLPWLAAPCNASLHQKNFLMPSRGMAGLSSSISCDFSSRVRRLHRSAARSLALSCGFWYGYCCAVAVVAIATRRERRINDFRVIIMSLWVGIAYLRRFVFFVAFFCCERSRTRMLRSFRPSP